MLREYIQHGGTPPTLSVGSYNTLSKTAVDYLDTGSRPLYLKKIGALYESIHDYNSKVIQNAKPEAIHDAAVALIDAMVKGL